PRHSERNEERPGGPRLLRQGVRGLSSQETDALHGRAALRNRRQYARSGPAGALRRRAGRRRRGRQEALLRRGSWEVGSEGSERTWPLVFASSIYCIFIQYRLRSEEHTSELQ